MNGPATLYGAEGLLALCELSAWICGVSGDLGEQRVERDRVRVVRRPPPARP